MKKERIKYSPKLAAYGYVLTSLLVVVYLLGIIYIASLFEMYSNAYIQRELTFTILAKHVFMDFMAVMLIKWTYWLWDEQCGFRMNRKLYFLGLFELVAYFFMVAMNAYIDRLSVKTYYLKPVVVTVELLLLCFYLYEEVLWIFHSDRYLFKRKRKGKDGIKLEK